MPCISYTPKNFHGLTRTRIEQANTILAEYAGQGLILTLRQLYYQFVARGLLPNTFRNYKKLQVTISEARLAGLIDWNYIEDRTRNLQVYRADESPAAAVTQLASDYRENLWDAQSHYVEVWVEKDALLGVIERACAKYRTPFFSCRGYTSQSELWGAAQRFIDTDKPGVVIHLGDHDPSGVDMTRDIQDRFSLFGAEVTVQRIALTMEQVRQYRPPPNPAKETDSRCHGYIRAYGRRSWELDALEPKVLVALIHSATKAYIQQKPWREALAHEEASRAALTKIADTL